MILNHHSIDMNKLRSSFVDTTPPINCVNESDIVGSIYIITDVRNDKIYVGQTKDFERRVSDYLRYGQNESFGYNSRVSRMYRILREEGIEHFKIRRLYDCTSYDELDRKEVEFIIDFRSILPEYGYNSTLNVFPKRNASKESTIHRSESHMGKPQSSSTLKKRGHECIAINPVEKRIYICDSMKLFGELILDKTKDIIGAASRRGGRINGFFIITEQSIARVLENGIDTWLNPKEYRYFCEYVRKSDISQFKTDDYRVYEVRYFEDAPGIRKL